MKILAIDTSRKEGILGLLSAVEDSGANGPSRSWTGSVDARHNSVLLPSLRGLLDDIGWSADELDLVVVGLGPGSFTGLRVGLSSAKGIAFAVGAPLVGIGTLPLLAASCSTAPGGSLVAPLIDAYRGEVYGALYRMPNDDASPGTAPTELLPPANGKSDEIEAQATQIAAGEPVAFVGSGFADVRPCPLTLARLGFIAFQQTGPSDLDSLLPIYLRGADAKLPTKRLAT